MEGLGFRVEGGGWRGEVLARRVDALVVDADLSLLAQRVTEMTGSKISIFNADLSRLA